MEEVLKEIADVLRTLENSNKIVDLTKKAVSQKIPVNTIMEEGLRKGLDEVGRKFEKGEYFLCDLLFAASMMEDATKVLEPYIKSGTTKEIGTIVLGTVQNDIHDIGKNVFKMMAETSGFKVIDVGVDVDPEVFVNKIKEANADIVGMSSLLTTTLKEMKAVVEELSKAGIRDKVKVILGGNAVTPEFGKEIKADAAALDAVDGITICKGWMKK